jgi:prefoldin alpha subunit
MSVVNLQIDFKTKGTIENNERVLVDYGTGFYVERSIEQGQMYCARKGQLIKDNMEKIAQNINQKKKIVDNITIILQKKMAILQQQQQAQKK